MQSHSTTEIDAEAVYHQFDPHTDSVVEEVLAAISGVRDLNLTESVPLAEVVDPDALEELFDPVVGGLGNVAAHVVFTYEGLRVTVESEGLVHVDAQPTV